MSLPSVIVTDSRLFGPCLAITLLLTTLAAGHMLTGLSSSTSSSGQSGPAQPIFPPTLILSDPTNPNRIPGRFDTPLKGTGHIRLSAPMVPLSIIAVASLALVLGINTGRKSHKTRSSIELEANPPPDSGT